MLRAPLETVRPAGGNVVGERVPTAARLGRGTIGCLARKPSAATYCRTSWRRDGRSRAGFERVSRCGSRKVRAPQGTVPGNARAPRGDGKCHREQTADGGFGRTGKGEKVG